MDKYMKALESIQQGYDMWIDELERKEHDTYSFYWPMSMGVVEVAKHDANISIDEFQQINNWELKRREDA